MGVGHAVGIDDQDDVRRLGGQVIPREIQCKALPATFGVEALNDLDAQSPRDRSSRVGTIIRDDKDPRVPFNRILEAREPCSENGFLIVSRHDDHRASAPASNGGLISQGADANEYFEGEAEGQQGQRRQENGDQDCHDPSLSNINAHRDCCGGRVRPKGGP